MATKAVGATVAEWKELPKLNWFQVQTAVLRDFTLSGWLWIAGVGLAIAAVTIAGPGPQSWFVRLLWDGMLVYLSFTVARMHSLGKPTSDLRRLIDAGLEPHSLVQFSILKNNQALGTDQGSVRFIEGALEFTGSQTRFRLKPEDVALPSDPYGSGPLLRQEEKKQRYGNADHRIAWGFDLAADPQVRVYFFPLKDPRSTSIYSPLFDWLEQKPPAQGETILPPLTPSPNPLSYRPLFGTIFQRLRNRRQTG